MIARARHALGRLALLGALVAALLPAAPNSAAADEVPKGAVWTEEYFESADGTKLHADVFRPEGYGRNDKTPVILAIGPYFGSGGYLPPTPTNEGPVMRFPELFTRGRIMERGYTYVQVDSRGFGSSGGCTDFGGDGEQSDVKAAVEWAASRPWSTGRVGTWGKSYDGWTGVMGLATDPKGLAAAVIQSPLLEGYRGLFMNGVHYDTGWYATPALYSYIDLAPPTLHSSPDEFVNAASGTATNPDCYAEQLALTTNPDHGSAYWRERNIVKKAGRSDVPVLWSHGFLDANTKADNFMDVYSRLDGPKRAWFGQYDHVRGNESKLVGRNGFMEEAMRWFDRYLMRDASARVEQDPNVEIQQDDGRWRAERSWPPADASRYALQVKKGSYQDAPGNEAEGSNAGTGTWSISRSLPYDVHLAGVPKLRVKAKTEAPDVHLVALLYDIDAKGNATLITRGASLVAESGRVGFELYPQDWRLERGHRIGLLLSGSDDSWFSPGLTHSEVEVVRGKLAAPFLRFDRDEFLEGGPAEAQESHDPFGVDRQTLTDRRTSFRLPPKLR